MTHFRILHSVGMVRVVQVISTFCTLKILPQQVVDVGVITKLVDSMFSLWIVCRPAVVECVVAEWSECTSLLYVGRLKPQTPLLCFVLDLLYKLFLCFFAALSKILTDTSRLAVHL